MYPYTGGQQMDYKLIRSRRKTIAICISRDGNVTVRAPINAPAGIIERFLSEKKVWIETKSGQMKSREAEREAFQQSGNAKLLFLGRYYPVETGDKAAFDGERFFLPNESPESLRPLIAQLYRTLAERVILPRVDFYSAKTGWRPSGVRIGSAKTAWGSCSGKNSLNFTWKLVAAEPDVIDYVVVHELAHIQEHNHSGKFWSLVEGVIPDFRTRRGKLRTLEDNLQKIGLS